MEEFNVKRKEPFTFPKPTSSLERKGPFSAPCEQLGLRKARFSAVFGRYRSGAAAPLCARLHARDIAGGDAGAAGGRAAARGPAVAGGNLELRLLQPPNLVAEPRRFLEFEIGGGGTHALLEIRDHRLEVGALVVTGLALREAHRQMVALVDAVEDVGDAALDALGRDAIGGVVGLLLLAPTVGFVDRRLHAGRRVIGVEDHAAFDVARGAAD